MKTRKAIMTAVALAGAMGTYSSAMAVVNFDATGTGNYAVGPGSENLTLLDWAPGNSLAQNGVTAIADSAINHGGGASAVTINFYYQASLGLYKTSATGNHLAPAGQEFTIVVGLQEHVTSTNAAPAPGIANTANFAWNGAGDTLKYLEIYQGALNANDLAGTGFNDGRLILKATISSVDPNSFSSVATPPQALDQSGANDYPADVTTIGNGQTQLQAVVDAFDANFFKFTPGSPQVINLAILQNIGLQTPFATVDPASGFVTGPNVTGIGTAGPAANPALGADNNPAFNTIGTLNGVNGTDFIIQTDSNQSFGQIVPSTVPEPMTAGLGMMGIAALGFSALRRRRLA